MNNSDSKPYNETPEEELKRLRKEIKQLKSRKQADKAKMDEMRKELKKKDVPTVKVTEEQKKLLLILFPDTDTLF